MRVAWMFVVSSLFFVHPERVNSQQASATVQRDPQAIAILTQALSAAGGTSAVGAVTDFTATGNVTYYWDTAVQGTVTVKGRGLHEFRVDSTLPDGLHSSITNPNASFQKNPDGTVVPLPSQNLVKPAVVTFPLAQALSVLQDPSVSLTYNGIVSHDGQRVHDVVAQKNFASGGDPGSALGSILKRHIFIDPNAVTVQSIADTAYRRDGGPGTYPHEMQFSNYQAVSGVLMPFSVNEVIAGQQTMSIQLTQITFNTGLTDSSFE